MFVADDTVGEAVHEGGEAVVELTEGRRLPTGEPLLHLAVPPGRYVPVCHAAPHPLFLPTSRAGRARVQRVAGSFTNVVGTYKDARPFAAMCAPDGAAGGKGSPRYVGRRSDRVYPPARRSEPIESDRR
ncbi:hypothetical protein GCM10017779_11880 [Streptomyces capillispiralis]|nr:hypothetical protein GCM10017779_11880 [Streptomyces capillispiralis]